MDLRLRGRRALVTGASRGIGAGIARALARERVSVAVVARQAKPLREAVTELEALGAAEVAAIAADVTADGQLQHAVEHAAERLGGLDLVVAAVGGTVGGASLVDSSSDDWTATYRLNVLHAANTVRFSLPYLRSSDAAAAVLVSSVSARRAAAPSSYATAKAATSHLARVLAWELAEDGIRVNAVSPGSTLAPGGGWEWVRERRPEEFADFAHEEFPAHRLVDVHEVAAATVFLLSPLAGGINGADIPVDGAQGRANIRRHWPRRART